MGRGGLDWDSGAVSISTSASAQSLVLWYQIHPHIMETHNFTKKSLLSFKMFYTRYDNVLTQYLQKGETFVHRKIITGTEMHGTPTRSQNKTVSCDSAGVLNLRA